MWTLQHTTVFFLKQNIFELEKNSYYVKADYWADQSCSKTAARSLAGGSHSANSSAFPKTFQKTYCAGGKEFFNLICDFE